MAILGGKNYFGLHFDFLGPLFLFFFWEVKTPLQLLPWIVIVTITTRGLLKTRVRILKAMIVKKLALAILLLLVVAVALAWTWVKREGLLESSSLSAE